MKFVDKDWILKWNVNIPNRNVNQMLTIKEYKKS